MKTPNAQEALAPRLLPEAEANEYYRVRLTACWAEAFRVLKDGGLLAFTFHHSEDSQWALVLQSLFESGFYLEQTYPIASDEMKGEGGQFGAKGTEYDMIHVCRKRLEEPAPVSWPKMRQWVKAELKRLRRLLDSYKARELSDADIRTILRGKALEFYSRHYGQVFTAENEPLSIGHALLGINQLLDEDTGQAGERPPSVVQPLAYQFLRLFGGHESLGRDEVGKSLRGTGIVQRELEQKGWIKEEDKTIYRVPVQERFEKARQRPRKEMKTEIDQAHFLIGAAMPGSGVNVEEELTRDTWMIRRSVEAVLDWYAKTALEPEVQKAAALPADIPRRTLQQNRCQAGRATGASCSTICTRSKSCKKWTGSSWKRQGCSIVWSPGPAAAADYRGRCRSSPYRAGMAGDGLSRCTARRPFHWCWWAGLQTVLTSLPDNDSRLSVAPAAHFAAEPGVRPPSGAGWGWSSAWTGRHAMFSLNEADDLVYFGRGTDRSKKVLYHAGHVERGRDRAGRLSTDRARKRRKSGAIMSNGSPDWTAGQRVSHPEMGPGVFIAAEPGGYARVFFQQVGERRVPTHRVATGRFLGRAGHRPYSGGRPGGPRTLVAGH